MCHGLPLDGLPYHGYSALTKTRHLIGQVAATHHGTLASWNNDCPANATLTYTVRMPTSTCAWKNAVGEMVSGHSSVYRIARLGIGWTGFGVWKDIKAATPLATYTLAFALFL
jgi:hypothetical protein